MEERINIAEILKNKPKGTSLWSMVLGKCTLEKVIIGRNYPIRVKSTNTRDFNSYSCEGIYDIGFEDSECILFPSKKMRDWNKFAWKKGDILVNKDGSVHIIFEEFENDTYKTFHGKNYLWENDGSIKNFEENEDYMQTSEFKKANKEDAQEYIHKIEKRLGGKLNMETLEIEKPQYEFKPLEYVLCKSIACYDLKAWNLFQYAYQNKEGAHIMLGGAAFMECIPLHRQRRTFRQRIKI